MGGTLKTPGPAWTFEELHEEYGKAIPDIKYPTAPREHLKALFRIVGDAVSPENAVAVSCIIKTLMATASERFQDVFALLLNSGRHYGFSVEFGACNGLAASDTSMPESSFDWGDIQAEPELSRHDSLPKHRTPGIDKRCVSAIIGNRLHFYKSDRLENLSLDKTHPHLGNVVHSYTVETVSSMDFLEDHDAPRYIDFLSIHTEVHDKEVFARRSCSVNAGSCWLQTNTTSGIRASGSNADYRGR